MCIHDVHSFRCYGSDGRPEVHQQKHNNLCAAQTPCPKELWERHVTHFISACPSCTGRSEVVPAMSYDKDNQRKPNERELQQGGLSEEKILEWANRYINDWAQIMDGIIVIATQPITLLPFTDQVDTVYRLLAESLCNDPSHYSGSCKCDAKRHIRTLFLYNPASALRAATVWEMWHRSMKLNPIPEEVCQYATAQLRELQHNRTETFPILRQERTRQPLLPADELLHRQGLVMKTIRDTFTVQGQALLKGSGSTGNESQLAVERMFRRYQVIKALGLMMMEDVGISGERLQLVVSLMAKIAREPKGGRWKRTNSLERLAWRVSGEESHDVTNKVTKVIEWHISWIQGQKDKWWKKLRQYQDFRFAFTKVTEELSRSEWDNLQSDGAVTKCNLCKHDFFSLPSCSHGPSTSTWIELEADDFSEDLNEKGTGDRPVIIKGCQHIFGERCLFRIWADTNSTKHWCCPGCGRPVDYTPPERGRRCSDGNPTGA